MPSSQHSTKMFAFDDPELNIPDPQKSPVTMVGADDSGIGMSLPRPVLGENQEKTNGSTGSCKSTDTVVSTSSVKKQWSPNAKRPKRRVQTISGPRFEDVYNLKDDMLGCGAYASVRTCVSTVTGKEYAVKIIEKRPGCSGGRTRVIKEIESFHMCANHPNIVQLIEYFEEDSKFYLVFEKMRGGPLLNHIQRQVAFTEFEACLVVKDIANALKFLHDKGIAHRDVKPENILCTYPDRAHPVKLCDLDLASKINQFPTSVTTPELQSPVGSAEFMAPEVVDAFVGEALTYDKRCDMWSLGVILYIMLCGYPPFYGDCWRPNCGWDQGLPCSDCQETLFGRIQKGAYYFPDEEWQHISRNAKDLIQHLLVRDATLRYTADDVLKHPWMQEDLPKTPLLTPEILQRKDSVRDIQQLNENFNAFTRIMTIQRRSRGSIDRVIANGLAPAASGGNILINALNSGMKARAAQLPRINRGSSRAPSGLCTPRDSCGGSASHEAQRKMSRGDHNADEGPVSVRV